MALGVGMAFYLNFIVLPGLVAFFSGSLSALVMTWGASQTFSKFEPRETISS